MKKIIVRLCTGAGSLLLLTGMLVASPRNNSKVKQDKGLEQADTHVKNPNAKRHIEANPRKHAAMVSQHKHHAGTHPRMAGDHKAAHDRAAGDHKTAMHPDTKAQERRVKTDSFEDRTERQRDRREDKAEMKSVKRDEKAERRDRREDRREARKEKKVRKHHFPAFHRHKDKKDKDKDRG